MVRREPMRKCISWCFSVVWSKISRSLITDIVERNDADQWVSNADRMFQPAHRSPAIGERQYTGQEDVIRYPPVATSAPGQSRQFASLSLPVSPRFHVVSGTDKKSATDRKNSIDGIFIQTRGRYRRHIGRRGPRVGRPAAHRQNPQGDCNVFEPRRMPLRRGSVCNRFGADQGDILPLQILSAGDRVGVHGGAHSTNHAPVR